MIINNYGCKALTFLITVSNSCCLSFSGFFIRENESRKLFIFLLLDLILQHKKNTSLKFQSLSWGTIFVLAEITVITETQPCATVKTPPLSTLNCTACRLPRPTPRLFSATSLNWNPVLVDNDCVFFSGKSSIAVSYCKALEPWTNTKV